MSMEPISEKTVLLIAKHYGLVPVRIKGTSQVQICKTMNEKKYEIISWEDFFSTLDEKGICVYKDASSCFLKIMKKRPQ